MSLPLLPAIRLVGAIRSPRMIRFALAALAASMLATAAQAASFSVKRGISLDLWTTWPGEGEWGDPAVMLPFPEWRRSLGQPELKALKNAGFDFVRMQVDPAVFLSDNSAALRPQLLDEVVQAARLVRQAGLKVIVDLHAIPAGERSVGTDEILADAALFDRYVELVRMVAARLAGENPGQTALELFNEPTSACEAASSDWPDKLKRLFAAARASATRLTLVLSGACWGSAEGLAVLDPKDIVDDNVLWSFHSYAPFVLTHQGATWAGDLAPYVTGLPFPPHAVPKAEMDAAVEAAKRRIRDEAPLARRAALVSYLDELVAEVDTAEELQGAMAAPFEAVTAWAARHGIAREDILLGEFGMIRQNYGVEFLMPPAWRAAYYGDVIALAESHGFAWAAFSYGGAFGLIEGFGGKPAEPDVMEAIRAMPPVP